MDLAESGHLALAGVRFFVLDEADLKGIFQIDPMVKGPACARAHHGPGGERAPGAGGRQVLCAGRGRP